MIELAADAKTIFDSIASGFSADARVLIEPPSDEYLPRNLALPNKVGESVEGIVAP